MVDLFSRQASHLHQIFWFDDREVVVGEETFADKAVGQFLVDSIDLGESDQCVFELFLQLFARHDLNIPPAELAGQSHILPAAPDGQGQLIFADQNDCPAEHLAEDDFVDLGRLERVGNQHLHVIAPANDVDAFAGQLVDNILDTISANADAGPHAVDALVGAADGDLRAVTWLACLGLDFDHSVADFRNLLLE